jgi:hypothetical protein
MIGEVSVPIPNVKLLSCVVKRKGIFIMFFLKEKFNVFSGSA